MLYYMHVKVVGKLWSQIIVLVLSTLNEYVDL